MIGMILLLQTVIKFSSEKSIQIMASTKATSFEMEPANKMLWYPFNASASTISEKKLNLSVVARGKELLPI